jgi:hypothetical protein
MILKNIYSQNIIFISIGLIQTILVLLFFDRADDHATFLEIAKFGMHEEGTVSDGAVFLFHILAQPILIIGQSEDIIILWFRFLSLLGFLFIYKAVENLSTQNHNLKSRSIYLTLVLLSPDFLAWTSSLLRDGVALLFWSLALVYLNSRARLWAIIFLICGIILRPQNTIFLLFFHINYFLLKIFSKSFCNIIFIASILITIILGFEYRKSFEPLISNAGSYGYPMIENLLDFGGFFKVFSQIILEPINLYNEGNLKLFELFSCVYFIVVNMVLIFVILKTKNKKELWFAYSIIYTLIVFGYFEYFISGFSRHRIFPLALSLAFVCINLKRKIEI